MIKASLVPLQFLLENNRVKLSGDFSFFTVLTVRQQGLDFIDQAKELSFDFAGVNKADSAGVALLIEWWRAAILQKKTIRFLNLPQAMQSLIRVSNLHEVLGESM